MRFQKGSHFFCAIKIVKVNQKLIEIPDRKHFNCHQK